MIVHGCPPKKSLFIVERKKNSKGYFKINLNSTYSYRTYWTV